MDVTGLAGMVLGAVAMVTVFSLVAILGWAGSRRQEREAYYRTDLLKQVATQPGPAADRVVDLLREDECKAERRWREGLKLGGLITTVVGIGIMVFLGMVVDEHEPIYLVGLIPLLVGVTMVFYSCVLAPRDGGR